MKTPFERREGVWGGIPVFTGTRIPIYFFIDFLETDSTIDEFLDNYDVTAEHIEALLEFSLPHSKA